MSEIENLLRIYSSEYYFTYASATKEDWSDVLKARLYLEKYHLSELEYNAKWKRIEHTIFYDDIRCDSDSIFRDSYELFMSIGGVTLTKDELIRLQRFWASLASNSFVIVQRSDANLDEPPIRMKFPMSISWDQLSAGAFISTALFEMPHNEFLIYAEEESWGRFVSNDSELPFYLTGVTSLCGEEYSREFKNSLTDIEQLRTTVPRKFLEANPARF